MSRGLIDAVLHGLFFQQCQGAMRSGSIADGAVIARSDSDEAIHEAMKKQEWIASLRSQ
jgi:hypothetical protein